MVQEHTNLEQSFLDMLPEAGVIVDSQATITVVGDRVTSVLGWTSEDIKGQHFHDALCAKDRSNQHSLEDCPITQAVRLPTLETNTTQLLSANGVNTSVDFRVLELSLAGRFAVTFHNNSAKPYTHAELVRFTEYVAHNPTAIAEFNLDGKLLFANPGFEAKMAKYGFDDNGIARIFPESLNYLIDKVSSTDNQRAFTEVDIEKNCFQWHFHFLPGENIGTVLAYVFDISEKKSVERSLAQRQARERRDFYSKMVHELRSPLNAIIGFAELIQNSEGEALTEKGRLNLEEIRVAGMQLDDLVTNTLDMSKIETGKVKVNRVAFQLSDFINGFSSQIDMLASSKGLEFKVYLDRDVKLVTDKQKARQIVVNLLSNAVKYTSSGKVELTINPVSSAEQMMLRMAVSDTGIGIPEEKLDKLFCLYERIDENNHDVRGTGLGLALVAEYVKLLNGNVSFQSEVGKGSIFTVDIPITLP